MPVADQPVGDFQQIRPGMPVFPIGRSGLPRAAKHLLEQIVGRIRPAGHAQQIAADRAAVVVDPCGIPFGLMIRLVRSHANQYKHRKRRFYCRKMLILW